MVRLKAPLFSLKASKQLGKVLVFKTKGNRALLTKYSKPGSVKPFTRSTEQAQMRTTYGAGVEAWNALSNVQKDVYRQNAKYEAYSGYNLFMQEWFETYQWQMYFSYHGERVYGLFIYAQQ